MRKSFLLVALTALAATRPVDLPFEKRTIDLGGNESAAITDLNGDGKLDIIAAGRATRNVKVYFNETAR